MAECLCTLYMYPEKYRQGLTGIIDIGGLNVNGSFYSDGHIDSERCFTIKCGKNIVIDALKTRFGEEFDGVFTRRDTEVFLNAGFVKRHEEESKKLIDEALHDQLDTIRETCLQNTWNLETCDLIFIGGMSEMLKDRIKAVFGKDAYVAKNAGYANADGYLTFFAAKLNQDNK